MPKMKGLKTNDELIAKANDLRTSVLNTVYKAKASCFGDAMSSVEILTALYYGELFGERVTKIDNFCPGSSDQDYVILSKGNALPVQYAILADLGFFHKDELNFYGQEKSLLKYPASLKVPGINLPGALPAMGLMMAVGLAMCLQMDRKQNRVFVLLSSSELQCGETFEALLIAAHYKLNNLIVFVDDNKFQVSGRIKATVDIDPVQEKFESFGWQVFKVNDGHNFDQLFQSLAKAFTSNRRPSCIWCSTLLGKGVSFAEGKPYYYHGFLSEAEYQEAKKILTSN